MAAIDLTPRTVGEILDGAFAVYRRRFLRLLALTFVVSLPALVFAAFFAGDAGAAAVAWWDVLAKTARTNPGDLQAAMQASNAGISKLQPYLLAQAAFQAFERAAGVVCMAITLRSVLAREELPAAFAVLKEAAPRLAGAVFVQLVLDLTLPYCILCCLPVGITLLVLFAATGAAIALERGPMERSLRENLPRALVVPLLPVVTAIDGVMRSVTLAADLRAIGRGTSLLFFLSALVGLANMTAIGLGVAIGGASGAWFWLNHCAEALALPVWGLAIALWHSDLRSRREGVDLEAAGPEAAA